MTPTQKAHIMASARKIHKRQATVTNAQIAIDMGLAIKHKDAVALCQSLGLFTYGKGKNYTKLETMLKHIKSK